jgi:hypothetical protein
VNSEVAVEELINLIKESEALGGDIKICDEKNLLDNSFRYNSCC